MTRPSDTIVRPFRLARLLLVGLMAPAWVGMAAGSGAAALACPTFGAKQTLATYWKSGLKEVSGLQSSLEHPGVLWAVQDSGNGPHLYALNTRGSVLATFTLNGANIQNVDWEAIAIDPRANARDYLYIGDIGDNAHNRNGTSRQLPALYRLREPDVSATWTGITRLITISSGVEKFPFKYYSADLRWQLPPRNAEAMFVDPRSHDVVIVQKDLSTVNGVPKQARVFTLPQTSLTTGATSQARSVGAVLGAGQGVQVGPRLRTSQPTDAGSWLRTTRRGSSGTGGGMNGWPRRSRTLL